MVTLATRKEDLKTIPPVKLEGLRRYLVLRAHPICIFLDAATWIWIVYFLWEHVWQYCVLLIVLERGFTWIMTQSVDSDAFVRTILGKLALLHLHPINLTLQICGLVLTLWGIWLHATIPILSGISLVLVGHGWGWAKIHRSFDLRGALKGGA